MTYSDLLRTEILKLRTLDEQTAEGLDSFRGQASNALLQVTLDKIGTRASFRAHRLEDLCAQKGWSGDRVPSRCLQGVQSEAREALGSRPSGPLTDAVLVGLALRLVHLGIASYQAALILSAAYPEFVRTLARSLDEEREADGELDWVLRSAVGPAAAQSEDAEPYPDRPRG